MATYQILYWDEIPVGVKATKDGRRGRVRKHLSGRFQIAVDMVATATGRTDEQRLSGGMVMGRPGRRIRGARTGGGPGHRTARNRLSPQAPFGSTAIYHHRPPGRVEAT